MGIFSCEYHKKDKVCRFKPYMEYYYKDEDNNSLWCYICFWHYIWIRFFKREESNGFARVDTDREAIEHILEELWSIECDIIGIEEKLGIKQKKIKYLKEEKK